MRHQINPLRLAARGTLLAMLAVLVLATTAIAGGWAQVSAQNVPVDPPAGEETTISLTMLQHGVTPVSWPRLTVIATEKATGNVVRAQAVATGPEGSYVAKITFPTDGQWTLIYTSEDLAMEGSTVLKVAAPAVAPAVVNPAAPAAAFDAMPLIAVLSVLVVLGVAWLALRGRGAPADTRISAGT